MKNLPLALSSLLLVGCTTAALKIANFPTRFGDHKVIKDVSYGDLTEQKLDIYIPPRAATEKQPIIVFFYGGRWTDGTKDLYAFVGDTFAAKGYITVVADYRKYPDVKFPDFVNDGAKAVAWTYTHIQDYGGNPENLYIAGHSSGAHIGALIAADDRYLRQEGVSSNIINAFAGLAGPYDFVPEAEDLKNIFGPPENYPQMQVTTFIDGNEPPMLLLWGEDDDVVLRRNIDRLATKIKSERGQVETKIYPAVGHVGIASSLTWFYREKKPVLEDIVAYIEKYHER